MNTAFVSGPTISVPTILAASMILLAPAVASADDACTPHAIQNQTKFPLRSQMRGHMGTVYLDVVVDEDGQPLSADLERSSGYRLLDRAATNSVMQNWVFDVSTCERKDLPVNHRVAVEYRNGQY